MNAQTRNAAAPLATLKPEHPRLIASKTTWDEIKARRHADAALDAFLRRGEVEARAVLTVPLVTYQKTGRRLLSVSRRALRRVLLLALHHRLTGDPALARRAEEEMLAAAAFPDWNPSHFLDVGEMTAALAFGYDWLYDVLPEKSREVIAMALVEKGLRPGAETEHHWERVQNNWNSVCLAGLSLGALALAEREPTLAAQILEKARTKNANGLKPYAPDGVYPEGAMYWGYGTTFQVVLLAALESALGTDWGLRESPGFLATAEALYQQLGPTGTYFNFSDNIERPDLEPAMWWFARTLKRPELLRYEMGRLREYAASKKPPRPEREGERLLPLAALWWMPGGDRAADAGPRLPRYWYGRGPNPLAVFRSAWDDPKALFLALKGGGASINHGHMDAGSFVFEADGVRWACDLGMQEYHSLESKGVALWNSAQDGGRWAVYRLGPFCHNTIVINDQLHRAAGLAHITHFGDRGDAPGAVVDLSPVFQGQAARVTRGFVFRPGSRHALIRDEVEGLRSGDVLRWAMLTRAEVAVSSDGTEATLTQDGQTLRARLNAPDGTRFEVTPADPPRDDFNAPNPGFRLLIARAIAPPSGRLDLSVLLQAGTGRPAQDELAPVELRRWPYSAAR
jgi:Heparinase II/III-like protein.